MKGYKIRGKTSGKIFRRKILFRQSHTYDCVDGVCSLQTASFTPLAAAASLTVGSTPTPHYSELQNSLFRYWPRQNQIAMIDVQGTT